MNEIKPTSHFQGEIIQKGHRPYWKRAHHDWRFWVALFLMMAASKPVASGTNTSSIKIEGYLLCSQDPNIMTLIHDQQSYPAIREIQGNIPKTIVKILK
jgi:hypothetical protein